VGHRADHHNEWVLKIVQFYTGDPPPFASHANDVMHTHAEYCTQLSDELTKRQQFLMGDQVVMEQSFVDPIEHLHQSNCEHVDMPYNLHSQLSGTFESSSHHALLQFMIAATPKSSIVQDILSKYDWFMSRMRSQFTHHLIGTHETTVEMIHNVPDTINPVKAKLAYVQVPHGTGTALNLVWKVYQHFF
jgi:extracellular elastinolytic metalloproteinase